MINFFFVFLQGNPKITLALVWTIILLWQETFKTGETTKSSTSSNHPVFPSSFEQQPLVSKMEKTLLDWCQDASVPSHDGAIDPPTVHDHIRDPIKITNFTSSFSNGLAFLSILTKFHPDLIDDTFISLNKNDPIKLLDYAFQKFESLGIPRLLDPDDFENISDSNKGIDKKSVMTYIMCIFRKLHVPGAISSRRHDTDSNSEEDYTKSKSTINDSIISSGISF